MCFLHYPVLFLIHSTESTHTHKLQDRGSFLFNLSNFHPVFSFFCAICLVFVVQSGYLTDIDAFGAFRREEDLSWERNKPLYTKTPKTSGLRRLSSELLILIFSSITTSSAEELLTYHHYQARPDQFYHLPDLSPVSLFPKAPFLMHLLHNPLHWSFPSLFPSYSPCQTVSPRWRIAVQGQSKLPYY